MRKSPFILGLCVALSLAGCVDLPPIKRAEVQKFSDIELNGPMPKAFREFVEEVDAYGALYVTKTGGGGGRIGRQPSLVAAKAGALAQCEAHNPDKECILYATKTP